MINSTGMNYRIIIQIQLTYILALRISKSKVLQLYGMLVGVGFPFAESTIKTSMDSLFTVPLYVFVSLLCNAQIPLDLGVDVLLVINSKNANLIYFICGCR